MGWVRIFCLCVLSATLASLSVDAQQDQDKTQAKADIPADAAQFDAMHRQFLTTEGLQLVRPVEQKTDPEETRPDRMPPGWLRGFSTGVALVLRVIFYIGAAALGGFVLYFVFVTLRQMDLGHLNANKDHHGLKDYVVTPALRPDAKAARTLLEQADTLARTGKFSEAVHLLLFRSIEDIQIRRKKRLPTALTAREIGQLDDLPARPREALNPIIALVEHSFFGGRAVDESGWQKARLAYETFAFGETWT